MSRDVYDETGIYALLGVERDPDIDAWVRRMLNAERLVSRLVAERDAALSIISEALPVVGYVSRGRGYVDVEPYPDATARRVNALMQDVLLSVAGGPS